MKKYNSYKDSGIEWIGEIPSHWSQKRLNHIGSFSSSGIDKKVNKDELEVNIINYTDIYNNDNFYIDSNVKLMTVTSTESKIHNHQVKKGDLIFTPSSETKDEIGMSAVVIDDLYNTSFSYHVLRFEFKENLDINFRKYLCNNHFVLSYFSKNSQGTTRQTLGRNDFNNTRVLIPPPEEQTTIANYLDRKTAAIDDLIEDKKRLLQLYEEEKQAVIDELVTGKKVWNGKEWTQPQEVKDSEIEWLGEIPKDWNLIKLKFISKLKSGSSITSQQIKEHESYPVYGGNGIRGFNERFTHEGEFILIGRQGAHCGNIKLTNGKFWASEHAVVVNKKQKFSNYFLSKLLDVMKLGQYSVSSAQPGLAVNKINELKIPFPSINEQETISNNIRKESTRLDSKIHNTNRLINLLQEYRQALISEVVTGKVKVTD